MTKQQLCEHASTSSLCQDTVVGLWSLTGGDSTTMQDSSTCMYKTSGKTTQADRVLLSFDPINVASYCICHHFILIYITFFQSLLFNLFFTRLTVRNPPLHPPPCGWWVRGKSYIAHFPKFAYVFTYVSKFMYIYVEFSTFRFISLHFHTFPYIFIHLHTFTYISVQFHTFLYLSIYSM